MNVLHLLSLPGGGGGRVSCTPSLAETTPSLTGYSLPHPLSGPGSGSPLPGPGRGIPLGRDMRPVTGIPPRKDMGPVEVLEMEMGYPFLSVNRQKPVKIIPSRRTTYAGGNNTSKRVPIGIAPNVFW